MFAKIETRRAVQITLIATTALLMTMAFVLVANANTDRVMPSFTATGNDDGSISLTWEKPPESPNDYRLNWGPVQDDDSVDYAGWSDENTSTAGNAYPAGSETSYTITDLEDGTYKVRLRARYTDNENGPFRESEAVSVTTTSDPAPDSTPEPTEEPTQEPTMPPRDIPSVAVSVEEQTVSVLWSSPSENPADYRVNWGPVDSNGNVSYASWNADNTDEAGNAYPTATSSHIADMAAGDYRVRVRARYDDDNNGPFHESTTFTVEPESLASKDDGDLGPKTITLGVDGGYREIDIAWSTVTGATGYHVAWGKVVNGTAQYITPFGTATTTGDDTTVTGIKHTVSVNEGTWKVRVRPRTSGSGATGTYGEYTESREVTVFDTPPVTNLTAVGGPGTIDVDWSAPSVPPKNYEVEWKSLDDSYSDTRSATTTRQYVTLTDLSPGNYKVRVHPYYENPTSYAAGPRVESGEITVTEAITPPVTPPPPDTLPSDGVLLSNVDKNAGANITLSSSSCDRGTVMIDGVETDIMDRPNCLVIPIKIGEGVIHTGPDDGPDDEDDEEVENVDWTHYGFNIDEIHIRIADYESGDKVTVTIRSEAGGAGKPGDIIVAFRQSYIQGDQMVFRPSGSQPDQRKCSWCQIPDHRATAFCSQRGTKPRPKPTYNAKLKPR